MKFKIYFQQVFLHHSLDVKIINKIKILCVIKYPKILLQESIHIEICIIDVY